MESAAALPAVPAELVMFMLYILKLLPDMRRVALASSEPAADA